MTVEDKIRDGKLQHNVNRETAKILALSSGKIDKYEYFIDKQYMVILPFDESRMIGQANFTYSSLREALRKQTKTIEDQGKNQIDAIMRRNERHIGLSSNDGKICFLKKYLKILFKNDLMKQ